MDFRAAREGQMPWAADSASFNEKLGLKMARWGSAEAPPATGGYKTANEREYTRITPPTHK